MNRTWKQIAISLIALTITSTAFAGSLEYDFRVDSESKDQNDAAGNVDFSRIYLQTGRLDYKAKASDDLSFRLRLRFNKSQAAGVNSNSSLNDSVDYASVSHKATDALTFTFGKFNTEMGGFEGNTAGPDFYLKGQAYNELSGLDLIYATGARAALVVDNHEISLLAANNATDSATQSRFLSGLVYKSKWLDNTLTAMLSYHAYAPQTPTNADESNVFTSLGLKYDVKTWFVLADYNLITYKAKASNTIDESTTGINVEGGYVWDQNTIKAKLESSSTKTTVAEVKTDYAGMGLAYEFKPISDVNFRYHLAYTTRTTKVSAVADKTTNYIIAGVRFMGDFLK